MQRSLNTTQVKKRGLQGLLGQFSSSFADGPSHLGGTQSYRKPHDLSLMRNSIYLNNPDALNEILSSKDDTRSLFSPTSTGNRM